MLSLSFFSTFSKIDCDELAHFLGELIIVFLVLFIGQLINLHAITNTYD